MKPIMYKGRPIGWQPKTEYVDYISSFVDLREILDDPEATQEQRDAAQGEIEMAMDDFS